MDEDNPILFVGGPWDGKWVKVNHYARTVIVRGLHTDSISGYGRIDVEHVSEYRRHEYRFVRLLGVGIMLDDAIYNQPDYLAKAIEKLVTGYRVVEQL